jgi:hypothetical protein
MKQYNLSGEDKKYFDYKVEHEYLTLGYFHRSVWRLEDLNANTDRKYSHNLTLLWIKQLLQEGKVKGRRDMYYRETDPEKIKPYKENAERSGSPFGGVYSSSGYKYLSGNSEKEIQEIEKAWNDCPPEELTVFEMSTIFTAPKNDWSKLT